MPLKDELNIDQGSGRLCLSKSDLYIYMVYKYE